MFILDIETILFPILCLILNASFDVLLSIIILLVFIFVLIFCNNKLLVYTIKLLVLANLV